VSSRFYSRKVLELFLNPPNSGVLESADGRGEAINTACSDQVTMMIRIVSGVIEDARFQTQGCAAAIAASAATTLLVKGKTVEEAESIDVDRVVEYLEGLPEAKIGCSVIAPLALQRAIGDWKSQQSS